MLLGYRVYWDQCFLEKLIYFAQTNKILIGPEQESERLIVLTLYLSVYDTHGGEGRALVKDLHHTLSIRPKHFMPVFCVSSSMVNCKLMAKTINRSHKGGRSGSRKRAEQVRMY